MKRAVFTVMILVVCLCSCKKQVAFEAKTSGFRCDAHVEYNQTELDCRLGIGENGDFYAEIQKPKSLDGMALEWSGDKVKVHYLGISKEIDSESIPYFNYAKTLRGILKGLKGEILAVAEANGYTYKGNAGGGDYEIEFRADGFPIKITVPNSGLTVTFSNFEYVY